MRGNARPAPGAQKRIDPLPPVPSEVRDGAERVDNWQPPCESPEARTANQPSRSFSRSSTVVSGAARPSAPNDCRSSGLSVSGKGQDDRGYLYAVRPGRVSAVVTSPSSTVRPTPSASASRATGAGFPTLPLPKVWTACTRPRRPQVAETGPVRPKNRAARARTAASVPPEPPPACPLPSRKVHSTRYRHLHQPATWRLSWNPFRTPPSDFATTR